MRLLNAATKRLELFYDNIPGYAILSHMWGKEEDEVLFRHIAGSDNDRREGEQRKGYAKIVAACKQAIEDGWEYIWIDTCCIDKESSAELSEAINSMYTWYWQSGVCYAYLEDVRNTQDMKSDRGVSFEQSRWFSRGWTLQELIAPRQVVFYSSDWVDIGTKASFQDTISNVTRIRAEMITGYDPKKASIAEIMSWASYRQTKRGEDEAYCLMGLFGVNMPLLYGEGKRAFIRLQEEIMKISDDHSIFAWKSDYDSNMGKVRGLLANSPWNFRDGGDVVRSDDEYVHAPYFMTHRGLQIQLPLRPINPKEDQIYIRSTPLNVFRNIYKATLRCTYRGKSRLEGNRWVVIYLAMANEGYSVRVFPHWLNETPKNPNRQEPTSLFVKQVNNSENHNLRRGFKVRILPTESGTTFKGESLANGYDHYDDLEQPEVLILCHEAELFGVAFGSDDGIPWLDILPPSECYNKESSRKNAKARHLDRLSANISDGWSVLVSTKQVPLSYKDRYHPTLFEIIIDIRRVPTNVGGEHILGADSNNNLLDDFDPHNVHSNFKKEASDWIAVFNPKVKRVLDVSLIHTFRHSSAPMLSFLGGVACIRFSSHGEHLATGYQCTAYVYNTKTGAALCTLYHDAKGSIYSRVLSLCFSPDNKFLATGASDGYIRIWKISKGRVHSIFNDGEGNICSLDFSPDGRFIVSGSNDGMVRIRNITNQTSRALAIDVPHPLKKGEVVGSVAFSSNGRLIAAGSTDAVIRIWDTETTQLLGKLQGHDGIVSSIAFMPDGKRLVSGSRDMTLKYWDISGLIINNIVGRIEGSTQGQRSADISIQCTINFRTTGSVSSVAVSHNGHWIISGLEDGSMQFLDSRYGTVGFKLWGHGQKATLVDTGPVDNIFATSSDHQVRICSSIDFRLSPAGVLINS